MASTQPNQTIERVEVPPSTRPRGVKLLHRPTEAEQEAARAGLARLMEETAARLPDVSPEEAEADALAAVKEVRQELHAARHGQ